MSLGTRTAETLHATLVARRLGGRRQGVLLRGGSGAGKSDLALRLIDRGWRLVADDRVVVWRSGGRLFGRAPEALGGLLEIRGQGVAAVTALDHAEILLVVDCLAGADAVERMPEPGAAEHRGVRTPRLRLRACEASAPAKVLAALDLKVL